MKIPKILSILQILVIFSSCKGNDSQAKVTPSNLTVETTISIDGSGLVTFYAAADKAVNFSFYFGEGANNPASSADGTATHTYTSSGTYSAKILASSIDNISIDKTVSITIQVNEPPIPTAGYTTPDHYTGMTLAWQDEFNGDHLNTGDWNYETGGSGWGNHELEFYTEQNTSVQDGYLIIHAKQESFGDKLYTSSRLTTQGKKSFQYGRIDIRALVPKGQGLWPALWAMGSSISTVGWPKCGEIDIMEMIGGGGKDSVVYGTAHWDNAGTHASFGGHKGLPDGHLLGDQFHVFSIVWTATAITWYLDDLPYQTIDIRPDELSELRQPFFFLFNVAVGGDWPGNPDATTVFPQRMVVDYVRVFQ